MSVVTPTYLNAVVNYLRGAGAPTAIAAIYLDLYNGDPQGSGASVLSIITGSATRSDITSTMSAASGGRSSNASIILITNAAAAAATVSYVAIFDAATSGNLVLSNALTSSQSVGLNSIVQFDATSLTIFMS